MESVSISPEIVQAGRSAQFFLREKALLTYLDKLVLADAEREQLRKLLANYTLAAETDAFRLGYQQGAAQKEEHFLQVFSQGIQNLHAKKGQSL